MEKTNTPQYKTKYLNHFRDFDPNKEKEGLKKLKRSFNKNEDDMYELPNNNKLHFNNVTKTMQSLSKDEIKDKIEAIDDMEEKKESKIYENDSTINKLEALKYMVANGQRSDEWQEAGLCNALIIIIMSNEDTFQKTYLDDLLEKASNN